MFKIVKDRRAWWPVRFNGVTEEGRVVENEIELRFFIHSEEDHLLLMAQAGKVGDRARELVVEELAAGKDVVTIDELPDGELGERLLRKMPAVMAEIFQRVACDWRKVGAENGEPLRFEPENIVQLMNVPGVFEASIAAYGKCRLGERDVREGN